MTVSLVEFTGLGELVYAKGVEGYGSLPWAPGQWWQSINKDKGYRKRKLAEDDDLHPVCLLEMMVPWFCFKGTILPLLSTMTLWMKLLPAPYQE